MKQINIILAIGNWNEQIFKKNKNKLKNFKLASNKKEFLILIKDFEINRIYIIHWNYKISQKILDKYKCISFHMTKLPYGRGGSPLQNLILLNKKFTYLTAFETSNNMDSGNIILQKKLFLNGSALSILKRTSNLCFSIIRDLNNKKIVSHPQKGKIVNFKRRKPEMSEIDFSMNCNNLYNFIRMLDAPIYNKSFINIKKYKVEFYDVKKTKGYLECKTKIFKS